MKTPPLISPAHRQRRIVAGTISTMTKANRNRKNHSSNKRQQNRRHRLHGRLCLPGDRAMTALAFAVGISLLISGTILWELIFKIPSTIRPASIFSSVFHHLPTSATYDREWDPELVFRRKVYRMNATKNPILVVGLPKAGTSSLFAYFNCLGFYSQHWYCCGPQHDAQKEGEAYLSDCMVSNLQDGLPILDGCGDYDVYTEMNGPRRRTNADQDFVAKDGVMGYRPRIFLPQHYHLEELHNYAPNATWILNLRPVHDWVGSVSNVPAKMLTKQLLYEARSQDPERWAQSDVWNIHGYRPTEVFLKEFWEEHVQRVTKFVADHPSHSLIWVNITNPYAGVQLARDLQDMGRTIQFPILQARGTRDKSKSNDGNDVLYSRAKTCWGAHNVKQHG